MFSPAMSRPFGIGAVAAQGIMPLLVGPTYLLIFLVGRGETPIAPEPGWVLPVIVALNVCVQVLAMIGAVGMYWIPRLLHLQRLDGYRVRPAGIGMLTYLGLFPPAVAAIGLAWERGDMPAWYFVLGASSWLVVVPAIVDWLPRRSLGTDVSPELGPEGFGSGPVGDLRPLGDFDLTVSPTWVVLPQAGDPGWARDAAAELSDIPRRRDQLARRLERVQSELTAEPHLMVGVWVPAPTSPEVVGMLTVDRIVAPAGQRVDRARYREMIEPDHRQKITVFGRYIDDIEVPAGPALLVTEVVGQPRSRWRPWDKMIGQNFIFTVFAPGCSEALQLAFSTSIVELQDALQADAVATMDTLTVSLRKVPAP